MDFRCFFMSIQKSVLKHQLVVFKIIHGFSMVFKCFFGQIRNYIFVYSNLEFYKYVDQRK